MVQDNARPPRSPSRTPELGWGPDSSVGTPRFPDGGEGARGGSVGGREGPQGMSDPPSTANPKSGCHDRSRVRVGRRGHWGPRDHRPVTGRGSEKILTDRPDVRGQTKTGRGRSPSHTPTGPVPSVQNTESVRSGRGTTGGSETTPGPAGCQWRTHVSPVSLHTGRYRFRWGPEAEVDGGLRGPRGGGRVW